MWTGILGELEDSAGLEERGLRKGCGSGSRSGPEEARDGR